MTTTIQQLDQAEWQEQAHTFHDYNYRQVWGFGVACAQRLGAASEHVAVRNAADVLALADVRIKRVPVLGGGIAYINGGPLVRRDDAGDGDRLASALAALQKEYVGERRLVLRIAPPLGPSEWNATQADVFTAAGFAAAREATGYRTMVVDVDRPLDEIRKSLAQKWRNCLNRAEKNGLTVRGGTDHALFDAFGKLFAELLARKAFDVDLDAAFYAGVQPGLDPADKFQVSLAELDGQPVAGHVASMVGDTAVYLLGASNDVALKQKASYLLQWDVIVRARERGIRWYDLGGIDPEGNPGVYHFKQGLGGVDISAPGPFEATPSGLRSTIALGGERLYRAVRSRR